MATAEIAYHAGDRAVGAQRHDGVSSQDLARGAEVVNAAANPNGIGWPGHGAILSVQITQRAEPGLFLLRQGDDAAPADRERLRLDTQVLEHFGLASDQPPDLDKWRRIVRRIREPEGDVTIAVVGKYTGLKDAYKSLAEALTHGGIANNTRVNLNWIESQVFESENTLDRLSDVHGILVPGGFGERGAVGKIEAARFARESRVPYFGICFGMQMAVIEAARNLAGIKGANSTEFGQCAHPVVGLMTEWTRGNVVERRQSNSDMGGTMRLGSYPAHLVPGSRIADIYGTLEIQERHRHRYEINVTYKDRLEEVGLRFSGMSPDGELPEIIELPDHPWYVGVQFHPELKSRPFAPHPLFTSFVAAALDKSRLI